MTDSLPVDTTNPNPPAVPLTQDQIVRAAKAPVQARLDAFEATELEAKKLTAPRLTELRKARDASTEHVRAAVDAAKAPILARRDASTAELRAQIAQIEASYAPELEAVDAAYADQIDNAGGTIEAQIKAIEAETSKVLLAARREATAEIDALVKAASGQRIFRFRLGGQDVRLQFRHGRAAKGEKADWWVWSPLVEPKHDY